MQAIPIPIRARAIRTTHTIGARQLEESKANKTTHWIAPQHTDHSSSTPSHAQEAMGSYPRSTTTLTRSQNRPQLDSSNNARGTIFHITHKRSMAHSQKAPLLTSPSFRSTQGSAPNSRIAHQIHCRHHAHRDRAIPSTHSQQSAHPRDSLYRSKTSSGTRHRSSHSPPHTRTTPE